MGRPTIVGGEDDQRILSGRDCRTFSITRPTASSMADMQAAKCVLVASVMSENRSRYFAGPATVHAGR